MKRLPTLALVTAAVALPVAVAAQDTGSEEMTLDSAPAWVVNTAERAAAQFFPGATLEIVQLDTEGPLPTFEFGGTSTDGAAFEIDVYPDGVLDEVEAAVGDDAVPSDVAALFAAQFPEFEVESVEQSIRPGRNGLDDIWFEWGGINAGSELDVEINEAGTAMLVEMPAPA